MNTGERDDALIDLHHQGYTLLPHNISLDLFENTIETCIRIFENQHGAISNVVNKAICFRKVMTQRDILCIAHDIFSGMFYILASRLSNDIRSIPSEAVLPNPKPSIFPKSTEKTCFCALHAHINFSDSPVIFNIKSGTHRDQKTSAVNSLKIEPRKILLTGNTLDFDLLPPSENSRLLTLTYGPTWIRPFDRTELQDSELPTLNSVERLLLGEPKDKDTDYWNPSDNLLKRLSEFAR